MSAVLKLPQKHNLIEFLKSKELSKEIVKTLLGDSAHELVQKPRLHFQSTPKGKGFLSIVRDFLSEEENELTWYDQFPKPLECYFRRDTFLTGGAVSALIFEKLTGHKAVINDVDLFFYHYSAKDQASAEQERYENLSGEDRAYYIRQVKEVGKLNLIQINLEDNFSWWKVIESFDLNYSQVGINLADGEIIFTKNFVDFLEKQIIELVPEFDQEFPLTSYLRGVHKSKDFGVPFYIRDLVQKYIAFDLGSIIFGDKEQTLPITHTKDEDGEFITEKRLQYWLKHPDSIPFMQPVILPVTQEDGKEVQNHEIKIKLPDEPWVGVTETVYQVFHRRNNNDAPSGVILKQLEQVIPNFYNLRPAMALRLKQVIQSKLFSTRIGNGDRTQLILALKNYPALLSKDMSTKKVTQVEGFLESHPAFKDMNYQLLTKGRSVDEILDCLIFLSKIDLALLGILETILLEDNRVQRYDLNRDEILDHLHKQNLTGLKESLEEVFKRRLEKNTVVHKDEQFNIKPFSRWVKELTQNDELILEGKNMNHCVGGYGEKVKRNESRIFHIQVGKSSSTIEIGVYLQKIVPKTDKQIHKVWEFKKYGYIPKNENEYLVELYSRREGKTKQVKHKVNLDRKDKVVKISNGQFGVETSAQPFTDKYTVSFQILQHRGKYNGTPFPSNQKVAELLIRYLNSEVSRNQKWIQNIIKGRITLENKVHQWPYLKLD